MIAIAGWVASRTGWSSRALLFCAGAVSVLGLPPFGLWPLLFLTVPILIWTLDERLVEGDPAKTVAADFAAQMRAGFGPGWWFGFGYFAVGLHWIASALLVEAELFAWLIPFALILLPGAIAIFFGLATALAALVWGGRAQRLVAFALAWMVLEVVRGTVLTGFPWNGLGTLLASDPVLMQSTALMGVYALAGVAALMFAAPAVWMARRHSDSGSVAKPVDGQPLRGGLVYLGLVGLLGLSLYGYGFARMAVVAPSLGTLPDVTLRLVQPSIPQSEKWAGDLRLRNFERQVALSGSEAPEGVDVTVRRQATGLIAPEAPVSHVVWPESAMPFWVLDEPQALLSFDTMLGDDRVLIAGALRYDPPALDAQGRMQPRNVYNSLMVFDWDARLSAVYDKRHLVPFGEYLPAQTLLESIGLQQITRMRGGFSVGTGPRRITAPGLATFAPLICYEAIFPGAAVDAGPRPGWLLNLTNDAWFGRSIGPHQHLHHARLRAVEEGLGLVRLANSGISAVIDPLGRIQAQLGLGAIGSLDTAVPAPLPPTHYAMWRPWPLIGFTLMLCLVLIALVRRNHRVASP